MDEMRNSHRLRFFCCQTAAKITGFFRDLWVFMIALEKQVKPRGEAVLV